MILSLPLITHILGFLDPSYLTFRSVSLVACILEHHSNEVSVNYFYF